MHIGGKTYRVDHAGDPPAPTMGERVIDFGGMLDWYLWFHKRGTNDFTVSRIDLDMTIYYLDDTTNAWTTPDGREYPEER
jgi:hypothetical protein